MSDYSVDSDSEDEKEEVDDVPPPKVTYNSLAQHSRKQTSQERLPETSTTSSHSTRNNSVNDGPRQHQNQSSNNSRSNFPSDFDKNFQARNFAAMADSRSRQQQAKMNMQNVQSKLEHGNYNTQGTRQHHPHFPDRDYQQNVSSRSSVRPKELQDAMHTTHKPRQPPRHENMNVPPPSAYHGSRQHENSSYMGNGPSSHMPRQPPRNGDVNTPSTSAYHDSGQQENPSYRSNGPNYATGGYARRRHNQNEYGTSMNAHELRPGNSSEDTYLFQRVDYRKLQEWSAFSNNTLLIFDVSVNLPGLCKLLKQDNIKFEWLCHLIIVLKKVISVESQKTTLNYILKSVCDSKFLIVHVHRFLSELQQQRTYPDTYGCFLKLVDVLEYVMKNMKVYASYCNQALQQLLDVGRNLNVLSQENELTRHIQKLLEWTNRRNTRSIQVPMNTELGLDRREKSVPVPDDEEPPDRYQEMSLFPDTEELAASVEPFLRANKTKGAYRDLTHYLDIHSRLMKEDYLSPIRTGLKNFKFATQNNTQVKEHDLRFYYSVRIAKISFESDQGITHFVHFDNSPFLGLDWEFSKRLMFGSLLVFSKDNFESTIFATVASRDLDRIQRGILEVMFQNNLEEVFTSSENDIFIMAETTAYFESYRYVLEGLREMQTIPLERYIISCMREIHPPQYVQENMCYNIASVMTNVYDSYIVPVLEDSEWPDADSTSLNDSQLDALKLALSKEIAVIQGPPGTGKTYVGLKIMRIILENKIMKKAVGSRGPILVVCFTNHALDQFLEGILDFCQSGIVRVGGRSSSTRLENFNLKQLRQNRSLSQKIPFRIHENLRSLRRQLKAVSMAINRHWQETLRLETTILRVRDLEEEMSEKHKESLTDPRRETNVGVHIMSTWLKASNANMDNYLYKAAVKHFGKIIAKGDSIQKDSSLINKKSALRTDFQTRVKVYNYWIKKYETFIEEEVEKLLVDLTPASERKLQVFVDARDEISSDVLRDDILKPYMGDRVYESIKGCVQLESKEEVEESSYVRHWLLNRVTRTDQLLDAIEQLTVKKQGPKQQRGRSRIFVDTDAAVHEDRWVIDDSDDSNGNSDESSDEDDKNEGRSMDDHDDGGTIKMSDIKELENSYKQFQDREIIMLQRAKMLGIDLTMEEDDQWQTANTMSYSKVFSLYHNAEAYTEQEAATITDVWSLQLRDRYRLYKYWVQERKAKLTTRLIDLTTEYKFISKAKKQAASFKDVAILKRARVIGMTTTGAAKHRDVLQEVGCRIIVVEEAAEVLEAHIVTTLNSHCQHLILIGDHQQLRPSPTVHKLAIDYDLEISLFERLVKNNIPHVTLTEQHRMRPEISTYLQHIYPNLQDHISVFNYEKIRGIKSSVYFLQHEYKESEVDDTTSKANIHEARFLTGLCKYLIQHEYLGSQITVLAAYSGQVKSIRDEMEKEEGIFEYVRVTSIDNYQGEENDIILLSLVRSNDMNEVGFLKTDNRVCVALSRAKMGLFVIGNLHQLALKSKLWSSIVKTAKEDGVFGVGMRMVCRNHKHVTYIVNPEDFAKEVPEGGCTRPCDATLPCGHTCPRMCHSSDMYHETTKCTQPCLKVCPQGHPCQKDCYRECGNCEVRVFKDIPLCGHRDQVACYLDVDKVLCSQSCSAMMACGHVCRGQCGVCMTKGHHQPCLEKVDKKWYCGHKSNVQCCVDILTDPCPMQCSVRLDCGHKCKGTCGGCLSGRVHKSCAEECKKPLPCGHPCKGLCGVVCVPCKLRCLTSCRHGPCSKLYCGDPCEPCMENCALVCQHRKCAALCMDDCVEPPCSKVCGKPTPCKHKCMSLCGEICVCYQCEKNHFHLIDISSKKKPQYVVAHEKQERAKKFTVDKETVLMKIPKCQHIFTLNQLDRYIESFEPMTTSFIRCPVCTAPVQGISRYEHVNRPRAEKRENMKEEIIQKSRVSERKIDKLIKSQLVVKDFCTVDEGEFLFRKPDSIDSNCALALCMQMRFAFALSKVNDIHKSFNQEIDFKIRKWKLIVSSIQQSMPPQLHTEMTMEIHRLLLCEQVTYLNKMFKNMGIPFKDEVKANLRTVLKELSKQQKLIREDKNSIQHTLDNLFEEFYQIAPSDEWSADTKSLQNQTASVTLVLDKPQTEDLITILQEIAPQEVTRVLEEDSDTENDESD